MAKVKRRKKSKGSITLKHAGASLTFGVHAASEEIKIRLESIDAPEKRGSQPFNARSKQALSG